MLASPEFHHGRSTAVAQACFALEIVLAVVAIPLGAHISRSRCYSLFVRSLPIHKQQTHLDYRPTATTGNGISDLVLAA